MLKRYTPLKGKPLKRRPNDQKKAIFDSLKSLGKRGLRLKPGDKKVSKSAVGETCERCGAQPVDPHHLIARDDETVRHEPLNIVYLCRPHHDSARDDKPEFDAWLEATYPGRLQKVKELSRLRSKSNIGYSGDAA